MSKISESIKRGLLEALDYTQKLAWQEERVRGVLLGRRMLFMLAKRRRVAHAKYIEDIDFNTATNVHVSRCCWIEIRNAYILARRIYNEHFKY
jgi:hypothetical protein